MKDRIAKIKALTDQEFINESIEGIKSNIQELPKAMQAKTNCQATKLWNQTKILKS